MNGSSGSSQSQTSTTTSPAGQQQNIDMLMSGARDYYNSGGAQYYEGQTYADTTAQQQQGREQAQQYATGVGQNLVNNQLSTDQYWTDNNNLFNFQNDPGYAGVRQGIINDTTKNLTESVLPQIRSGSAATGSLGGSRQGIAEGVAIGNTNKELSTSLANLDSNMYSQNLNRQNQAMNRASSNYDLGLNPSQTLQSVGEQYQSDEQKAIDEDMARWNFDQMQPLLNLQNLQQLTGTTGQYGSTTSQSGTSTGGGSNGLLQGLGGLLTGIAAFYQ